VKRVVPFILLIVACTKEPAAPSFRASCKPNEALEALVCSVENVGKASGRACLTARLDFTKDPKKQQMFVAQRACTAVIEPGKAVTVKPMFDEDIRKKCTPDPPTEFSCEISILETPQALGENLPSMK
jgi:hypothetical protein